MEANGLPGPSVLLTNWLGEKQPQTEAMLKTLPVRDLLTLRQISHACKSAVDNYLAPREQEAGTKIAALQGRDLIAGDWRKLKLGDLAWANSNFPAPTYTELEQALEIVPAIDWRAFEAYGRVYPKRIELSEEEQKQLDGLSEHYAALADAIESGEANASAEIEFESLEAQINAFEARAEVYTGEDLAKAGAIVSLDYQGTVKVERGLIRPEDRQGPLTVPSGETKTKAEKAGHSAALVEELTAHKSAAIRAECANHRHVALASVVHALLLQTMLSHASGRTCLELRLTSVALANHMNEPEASLALAASDELKRRFGHAIPGEHDAIFDWCLERSGEELLALLAFAAAHSINAVQDKYGFRRRAYAHADRLAAALDLDMCTWYEPTAENYFGRISKPMIKAALAEAKGEDFATGIAAMKKAEAAAYAQAQLKGTGWLPRPIRFHFQRSGRRGGGTGPDDAATPRRSFPRRLSDSHQAGRGFLRRDRGISKSVGALDNDPYCWHK